MITPSAIHYVKYKLIIIEKSVFKQRNSQNKQTNKMSGTYVEYLKWVTINK